MALKEAYTSKELVQLLDCAVQSINRAGKRDSWQSRPRSGRGGGNEWLVSSMPQATQEAIRNAEERKAIEEESAKSAALPEVLDAKTNLAVLPPNKRQAILYDKRRKKAMLKDDLLVLYLKWQRKHGATVAQKDAFILAYKNGAWPELLAALGPKISWKTIEHWKLERKEAGTLLVLTDARGIAHRGKSMITERHKGIILGQVLDGPQVDDLGAGGLDVGIVPGQQLQVLQPLGGKGHGGLHGASSFKWIFLSVPIMP